MPSFPLQNSQRHQYVLALEVQVPANLDTPGDKEQDGRKGGWRFLSPCWGAGTEWGPCFLLLDVILITLWGTWVAIKLNSVLWHFLSKFLVKCRWGISSTVIQWACTTQSVFMETGYMLEANIKHTTWSGSRHNDRCGKRQKMVIIENQWWRRERSCYVLHYLCSCSNIKEDRQLPRAGARGCGRRLKCLVEMAFQLYKTERATEMGGGGGGCAPLCVTPLNCTLKRGSLKMVILWYACFLTIGKDFWKATIQRAFERLHFRPKEYTKCVFSNLAR